MQKLGALGALSVLLLVFTGVGAGSSTALESEIIFGGVGGSPQTVFQNTIIPMFEKQYPGTKVTYVTGTPNSHYANIVADPTRPQYDVVWSDTNTHEYGKALGYFQTFNKKSMSNLPKVYPAFRKDPVGVISSNSAIGIMYNPAAFKNAGIPVPKSWKDLWNPKLKGHVGVWTVPNAYGNVFVLVAGKTWGKGYSDYAAAYPKIKDLGSPTLLDGPATAEQLFSNGTIWALPNSDARTYQAKDKGLPAAFTVPKEGAIGIYNLMDIPKSAPHPNAARAWANFMINDRVQEIIAKELAIGPTNMKVRLKPTMKKRLINTPQEVQSLVVPDWRQLLKDLPQITTDFNAKVAG